MAHEIMPGLIEGLPDAVALNCLARVPFYYHRNLRLVCRSWRAALCAPELFKARCEAGVSEELLCVIHCTMASNTENVCQLYDPFKGHWLTLTTMPSELRYLHYFGVASVAGKLFMLGGTGRGIALCIGDPSTSEVWSYDPFCCEWSRRANMLVPRANFACCSLEGKIFVAGGFASSGFFKSSRITISKAEFYDPDTDTWRPLPDLPHTHPSDCSGVLIGGKIHVFYEGLSAVQILEDGRQWSVEDFGWPQGPMAVVGEELYILNAEGFILKHQQENNIFYRLAAPPLPFHASYSDNWELLFIMIGVGDDLYVIGPGRTYWWNEKLVIVNVLPVNSNSPTWRNSKMTVHSRNILNCASLRV